jgi:hypothetical protein
MKGNVMDTTLKGSAIMIASTAAVTSISVPNPSENLGPAPLSTIESQVLARLIVDPEARSANDR